MPIHTFSTYRSISIFFVTLAVADGLYRHQVIKKLQEKLFKPTWIGKFLMAAYRLIEEQVVVRGLGRALSYGLPSEEASSINLPSLGISNYVWPLKV
jgi:hypothetical protein